MGARMLALRAQCPAPGELISLPDGRRLNLTSIGSDAPTVVMEAGPGDWSLHLVSRGAGRPAG